MGTWQKPDLSENLRRFAISYFPFPISHFPFPISHFPLPMSQFHLPMPKPGGMRGAIESAALAVGMAWRVGLKAQKSESPISICRSQPPQKSPQRPCAFRPAALKRAWSWFCDFQKTLACAEQEAKKVFNQRLVTNLHQKCKLQDASLMIFML